MSNSNAFSLRQLGWRPGFSTQLSLADLASGYPARVAGVYRSGLVVLSEQGEHGVSVPARLLKECDASIAVGDWLLVDTATGRVLRVLERESLLTRLAAGIEQRVQPIAANLDRLFVVTSCNNEFNASRLERYLAIALQARVEPVILLTKTDLCETPARFVAEAQHVAPGVSVVPVDALTANVASLLAPWLGAGQTVAFVGSSGVGKSTLINGLVGRALQATGGIREHDAHGRHTTTAREMIAMQAGAWLIDTPGMRELKVGAAVSGVSDAFADLEALAARCRFRDCGHEADEGCALEDAVRRGEVDARRVRNYLKLRREAANAAMSQHERRARDRRVGRVHKQVKAQRSRERDRFA